jgi:hypothetical protein
MAEKKNPLLKISLAVFAIITLVYGVIYVFVPEFEIKAAGTEPINPGWIRWFGGVLIALGIGSMMVFRNPVKQGIFITTLAIGTLFVSLTLVYSIIYETESQEHLLHALIPAIVMLLLSVLFWISRKQSKAILW